MTNRPHPDRRLGESSLTRSPLRPVTTTHLASAWPAVLPGWNRNAGAARKPGPSAGRAGPGRVGYTAGVYHPGMAYNELLAGRGRNCLRPAAGGSEKKMVGGLALMTRGHPTVGGSWDRLIAPVGGPG